MSTSLPKPDLPQEPSKTRRVAERFESDIIATLNGQKARISNLSFIGCFLNGHAELNPGDQITLHIGQQKHRLRAEVSRQNEHGVGLHFIEPERATRKFIRAAVKELHLRDGDRFVADATLNRRKSCGQYSDPDTLNSVLASLSKDDATCTLVSTDAAGNRIGSLFFEEGALSLRLGNNDKWVTADSGLEQNESVYVCVKHNFDRVFFLSKIKSINNERVDLELPDRIVFSDRREEARQETEGEVEIQAELSPSGTRLQGSVKNFSTYGLLVECDASDDITPQTTLNSIDLKSTSDDLSLNADIGEVVSINDIDNKRVAIGIALQRPSAQVAQAKEPPRSWLSRSWQLLMKPLAYLEYRRDRKRGKGVLGTGETLFLKKPNGTHLAAIINRSEVRDSVLPPRAVLIVPGFAMRKEAMVALANTITWNAKQRGEDITVLRFDLSNNVGKSHKEGGDFGDGRDSLHYTIGDTVDDIETAVGFIRTLAGLRDCRLDILSASISSVSARHAIAHRLSDKNLGHWLSYMGAADLQNAVMNVGGNVDAWGNYKAGIKMGPQNFFGCMVDAERFCADAEKLQAAVVADGEKDMAQIKIPVTWLLGIYDAWMDPVRVKRLMTTPASAPRHLIELESGHVPKSSDQALSHFRLIDEIFAESAHSNGVRASKIPPLGALLAQSEREWKNARGETKAPDEEYWRDYLFGDEGHVYEVLGGLEAYRLFCAAQAELGQVRDARVVELGSGTGLVSEAIVQFGAKSLVGTELVPDAVKFLSKKFEGEVSYRAQQHNADEPLPFADKSQDVVVASLLLSYLKSPHQTLCEAKRVLAPGGRIVISTMKPDADSSVIFREYVEQITADAPDQQSAEAVMNSARALLDRAGELMRFEEDQTFKFFGIDEMRALLVDAGFVDVKTHLSYGDPAQAIIAVGRKQ